MQRCLNVIDMYHGNDIASKTGMSEPDVFKMLAANGVLAIIHKVSQGVNYSDPRYADRRKMVEDAGMLWGGYHFIDSSDAVAQSDHFLNIVNANNAAPCLVACDYENSTHQASLQQCMTFMREVDQGSQPGVQCVLYSGNLIRETLKPHAGGHQASDMQGVEYFFQQHRLWLAEYGPREQIPFPWDQPVIKSGNQVTPLPAPGVFLWQYTETGRMRPLHGFTDGNFFDGTMDELKARWLA